ncbi:UNVERIFIED_CONTAM: hypothetical protein Sangu_0058300 [Sesamum angustifolium]|uniref:Zinc finger PHD-type domain-containing protein n=1 Tax=Sesamum angustifolium TaxID=2727405 RepID=A0AAW2RI48_9LAMI
MEFKHFSHNHGLVFHQLPQGSEIHCSGCKSPGLGNVYACWQCSYFLHEQCFRAARSLKHPSHPLHPLTLVPFPTYPSGSFFCNSCNHAGYGFSYSCSECEFDIHVHCAHLPNPNSHVSPSPIANPNFSQNFNPQPQNPIYPPPIQTNAFPVPVNAATTSTPPPPPQPTYSTVVNTTTNPPPPVSQPIPPQFPQTSNPEPKPAPSIIKHFSHPHVLKAMEIEKKNAKVCSACECELSGSAYCCTEPYCTFNLHKSCFDSPREVRHKSHLQHPLTLLTAPPYEDGFTCNACLKDGKAFAYTCSTCSYDLHIDCIQWPDTVTRPDHKHALALYYSSPAAEVSPEATFMCDVCKNPVHEMAWVYYCRECDFGTHLECVTSGIKEQVVSGAGAKTDEELLRETELKFAVLQLLLGAQGRNAALELI